MIGYPQALRNTLGLAARQLPGVAMRGGQEFAKLPTTWDKVVTTN
jgi:hypothetical protein